MSEPLTEKRMYLDTRVPSACYDDRLPDRRDMTRRFWRSTIPQFDVFVSELTTREIQQTRNPARRKSLMALINPLDLLPLVPQTQALGETFIREGLLPAKRWADAYHLAIAVANGMDLLVSWNYDEIVNIRTKRLLPVLSVKHGYPRWPMILTPQEFPSGE